MGTVVALIAFGATFAYYVSSKLSTEAINVAVGALCGMAASLPVSIGLLVALTRQREPIDGQESHQDLRSIPSVGAPPRPHLPQLIVIAPPQGQYAAGSVPFTYPVGRPLPYPNHLKESDDVVEGRNWRLIGEDE